MDVDAALTTTMDTTTDPDFNFRETSYILVGNYLRYLPQQMAVARKMRAQRGTRASVETDWEWALKREEKHEDVIGFFHTHPPGCPSPSSRDDETMWQWSACFGKPLLCVIECDEVIQCWWYLKEYSFFGDEVSKQKMGWYAVEEVISKNTLVIDLNGVAL